jgi:iron complex outermembrane receptor protein
MNRVYKFALLFTAALNLALSAPVVARAAESTEQEVQQIEQVVVTATRRAERLQTVPISISVFSQKQLSEYNVVSAQDLATYTPSLSANNNFGSQNSSYAIRGFVQDTGTAPSVGVYFADVVAPRGASPEISVGDGAGPGDFFDLQNVQVLKGPQGTLFGRNTTGGAVLLVPNKPSSEFGGYVEGEVGNYNMNGGQAVLNLPINDNMRLRIGVDHESRDGYLHNTSGIGPIVFNDVNYTALRLGFDVDITPDLENYTIATYTTSDTRGDVQKMIACDSGSTAQGALLFIDIGGACTQFASQGKNFYDIQQNISNPYSKLVTWRLINTTTWDVSDNLTVKNIASYAQLNDKLHSALFGTNFNTPDLSGLNPLLVSYPFNLSNVTPLPGGSTSDQSTYTEELQFQGRAWNDRLIWQAGGYLEGSEPLAASGSQSPGEIYCTNPDKLQCYDVISYLLSTFGEVPAGTAIGAVNYGAARTAYRDYAVYAQATYKLTDEFKLTGGIRYTHDQETSSDEDITYHFGYPGQPVTATPSCTNVGAPAATCILSYKENSSAPTWLVDLDYTPSDNLLAYAKYSRGYRAGVINPGLTAPYDMVQPEKVDTYEVGLKTSFEGAISGTFDVAGFYNDFSNQQLQLGFFPNPCYTMAGGVCIPASVTPAASPVNAGQSRIYGAELDAVLIPYEGVTVHVGYSYLNTAITSLNLPSTPAGSLYVVEGAQTVGDHLALTPTNKLVVNVNYALPLAESIGKITLGATFTHTDSMLSNYDDRGDANPAIARLGTLPETDLVDLSANWEGVLGQPFDLSIFATNVTDKHYYTFVPGLVTAVGFETAQVAPPAMYGVRLRYNFGEQ